MRQLHEALISRFPESWGRYPLFREQIDLVVGNSIVLLAALAGVAVLAALPVSRTRSILRRAAFSVFVALPFLTRAAYDVSYDTSVAVLTFAADLVLLAWVVYTVTAWHKSPLASGERLCLGTASLVLGALALTLLRAQASLLTPSAIPHFLVTAAFLWRFWTGREAAFLHRGHGARSVSFRVVALGVLVFALPFLPHAFIPAPPDADPTTWAEMVGFLFQGESLSDVQSGVTGERFGFKYPAGVPAAAWAISHLFDLRASESLLLLWVGTHAVFLLALAGLSRVVRAPVWVALLFSLNLAVTGYFGLYGGQINRELPYALGLLALVFTLRRGWLPAGISVGAALVCNTLVALPFVATFMFVLGVAALRRELGPGWARSLIPVGVAVAYIVFLGSGAGDFPNAPAMVLRDLTPAQFLDNVTYEVRARFSWASLGLVGLFVPLLTLKAERAHAIALSAWLGSTLMISGLFGTFVAFGWPCPLYGGFALVGPVIIGIALLCRASAERFFTSTPAVTGAAFALAWVAFFFPGFILRPTSVFATHSDVRMGRWIERHLPPDALIANFTPYSETWAHRRINFSYARGDGSRSVLFARVADYHLRDGRVPDRGAIIAALEPRATLDQVALVFRRSGATHLLLAARPETDLLAQSSSLAPLHRIGSTWLFDLSSK